ncbi:MAG: 30S ribosomal protein S9, partial [Chloroflexota bacterium]
MADATYFYGLGRRKCAVARVRLLPGDGRVMVNGKPVADYFGRGTLEAMVR